MPGDGSCLYHARRAWFAPVVAGRRAGGDLVEAPGTAPGSATLISQAVYRHSRLPDAVNIMMHPGRRNPGRRDHPAPGKIVLSVRE